MSGGYSELLAVLGIGVVLAQGSEPVRTVTFEDLDRLYFEKIDRTVVSPAREKALALLPSSLPPAGEAGDPEGAKEEREVRTFPLPAPPRAVLLQVVDRSNPRLAEQHWALYTEGRRTDEWFFSLAPAGKDGKALATYEVQRVHDAAPGWVVLETCGSVFRPEGAWWWEGRNLHFVADGDRLRFDHVVTRFYASGGADLAGEPPLTVYDEREGPDGRIEVRAVDAVTKAGIAECRFPDPFTDAEASCVSLERASRCLTARPEARTSYRERGIPSFIEKGGRPRGGGP